MGAGFVENKGQSAAWALAGIGKGTLAPWKCCKVFCALAVRVELFVHYFHNKGSGWFI